ncbi:MAG: translocation/assembly module TamB domain-containing protein [Bacteroidales bacterium]
MLAILSNSVVQTFIAQKIAARLSSELHTEISISRLRISPNLHIVLEEIFINDQYHKTLLRSNQIDCKIRKLSFLKRKIEFSKVLFSDNEVAIVKYKNDSVSNFQFLIDYFKSKDTITTKGKDWKISGRSFEIKNTKFKFQNQDYMNFVNQGIDFNNLLLTDMNFKIDTLLLNKDTLNIDINKLSFKDKSGFVLNNLTTRINYYPGFIGLKYLSLETPKTNLSLDCSFIYNDAKDLSDFMDKVQLQASIRPSKLDMKDLAFFFNRLKGMDNLLSFSGKILGKVSNIKLREFKFGYGRSTSFEGAISLNGLPNIEETFIRLTVNKFTTSKADIDNFIIPGIYSKHIQIPEQLLSFGNVMVKGDFTGFYNNFNAYADFATQNGNFSTDITLKKTNNNIEYNGHLAAVQFNIGSIFNIPNVMGKLNMDAEISGSGLTANTAKVKMTGGINRFEFKGNIYDSIAIKGEIANNQFNGYLGVKDDKIDLNFLGVIDFTAKLPVFDFTATIRDANLYRLKLINFDSTSILNTQLNFNFTGNKADDIVGTIKVENTSYSRDKDIFRMRKLSLITYNDTIGERKINLYSDFIDADMHGKFKFEDLPIVFKKFINNYLPSVGVVKPKDEKTAILNNEQRFDFNINLKNTEVLSRLLSSNIKLSKNSIINGSYNSQNSIFRINCLADTIHINNQILDKCYLEGITDEKRLYLLSGCQHLHFNENMGIDNFKINSLVQSDSIFYSINWKDSLRKVKNKGDIIGFISFEKAAFLDMKIVRSDIVINDSIWHLYGENYLSMNDKDITIQNLILGDERQSIKIDGKISKNPVDKLILNFNHFNMSQLDFLIADNNIDVDGIIDGNIELVDLYKSPNFITDLTIFNVCFNKGYLGDMRVISTWDKEKDALFLSTNLIYTGNIGKDTTLFVKGYYFPNNKDQNFDFTARLNQLKLKSLTHYFKSFSSKFDGLAVGNLSLKGNFHNPEINGKILLQRGKIKIDYTNVFYTISPTDSIEINTNYFKFTNIGIASEIYGRAMMDGIITHRGFRNIMIDLTLKYKNLMVLDTKSTDNELFYGKAFASGIIKINGFTNDIHLDIRAKTDKETMLYIPLINKTETRENNFITFIEKQKEFKIPTKSSNRFDGISMKCELEVTPDAEIGINLETPQTIGNIKAFGDGNIQLTINKEGDFKMFGDYTLRDGLYYFSIQNIISKKFNIQNGGNINWNGDPYDATVKMKAIYNLRASLYPVLLLGTSEVISKKKVPVQSIISIEGKLNNPTIDFDINLPSIDQETKDRFFSLLDRNDKELMTKQNFSLLVTNSFISQNRNTYSSSVSSGVGNSSFEMVSNQISNWLSQISKDFDIGVNYRPGDQLSSQELQLALSTQIFNDRVSIDGNLGVGGELKTASANQTTKTSSNIVGDVNVEYKITEDGRFRMKVFNRANTNEFMNTISPYTQGVGFFYRREFDSIKELFSDPKK